MNVPKNHETSAPRKGRNVSLHEKIEKDPEGDSTSPALLRLNLTGPQWWIHQRNKQTSEKIIADDPR
jgi:hypothetical protein